MRVQFPCGPSSTSKFAVNPYWYEAHRNVHFCSIHRHGITTAASIQLGSHLSRRATKSVSITFHASGPPPHSAGAQIARKEMRVVASGRVDVDMDALGCADGWRLIDTVGINADAKINYARVSAKLVHAHHIQ